MEDETYSSRESFELTIEKMVNEERWDDVGGYLRHACLLYPDLVGDIHNGLLEAAQYYERGGNNVEQAWCYHDLGSWYLEETKGEIAVKWLEKSKLLFQKLGETPGAEEGLSSTEYELEKILSSKPFRDSPPPEWKKEDLWENRNLIEMDPTNMPAIIITAGLMLMMASILPLYINTNYIGISIFSSICLLGIIIFVTGVIKYIKVKFNK